MSNTKADSEIEVVEEEKKTTGFFSKVLLLWVLPLIYALALGSIILHFAGHSFSSQATWIYDHTKVLIEKKEKAEKKEEKKKEKASSEKKDTVATADEKNSSKETETTTDNSSQINDAETNTTSEKTIATSLSSMDVSTAAKLLSNMTDAVALENLRQLQPKIQSAIISKLSTEMGARMIVGLASEDEPEKMTTSASQLYQHMQPKQIAAILNEIDNNTVILNQIRIMDPSVSSKVISLLDPKIAGWIITQLKP